MDPKLSIVENKFNIIPENEIFGLKKLVTLLL
jgi:hypothetical protein